MKWLPAGSDHALLFSGRTAIETVLRDIGNNAGNALLPSYCCASMIEPFLAAGYAVKFYEVSGTDGISVAMDIPEACSVLLWCNYFGFHMDYPREEIRRFRKRGGIVIEDITHSLLSKKQCHGESDYLVASIRKWGALLSGGFCGKTAGWFAEKPERKPHADFLRQKADAMALKEEYLRDGDAAKKEHYLQMFAQSNQWLAEYWSGLTMDEESRRVLLSWDVCAMREQRRRNAAVLYRGLAECGGVKPLFPFEKMDCPLFVPICVKAEERDAVRRRLIKEEIYCPVHWPKPSAECVSSLYDTELSLICDQRYGQEDMRRILSALQKM